VRDVTRQTPRFDGDCPKSGRPSVRQSRREALCSPGTNRPKRFPTATRLAPRPPDPLRFLPPDSDPQKSGSRVARVRKGFFDLSAKSACGAGLAASAFVPAPVGPTLRRTSVTLRPPCPAIAPAALPHGATADCETDFAEDKPDVDLFPSLAYHAVSIAYNMV